jgi:hypothetical protein
VENAGFMRSNSTATAWQVHVRDAAVKVFTRRGNDWTNRFRKIAADAWHISAGSVISTARSWCPRQTAQPTQLRK